jgi:4-hydroxythreonine-4-phosphate dehydrogenase
MKKVVITMGDPAGCGPAICLGAIDHLKKRNVDFILVGDKKILKKYPLFDKLKTRISLVNVNTPGIEKLKRGRSSRLGGQASLNYLNEALKIVEDVAVKRLVTAPISKEAVQFLIPQFSGHTEYLADYFKIKNFAMMMTSNKIKTVLFTRHSPLSKVSSLMKERDLSNVISLVYDALKNVFKIKSPRIAFASFNPHAGIDTFLWKEEKAIASAIKRSGKKVFGPYPADTIFIKDNLKKYDCIICPYHDQAMIPFKLLSFKEGINLTLGLPIIRTSPAHGVAYDLVRSRKTPFYSSMAQAIELALRLNA